MTTASDIPFDDSDPEFLGQYRYAAAGFIKYLILARAKQEPVFLTEEMHDRWNLEDYAPATWPCEYLLRLAEQGRRAVMRKYLGDQGSLTGPQTEEEASFDTLRMNVADFVIGSLNRVVTRVQKGQTVDWDQVARWDLLPEIRDGLNRLPKPVETPRRGRWTASYPKAWLAQMFNVHRNQVDKLVLATHHYEKVGGKYRLLESDMPSGYLEVAKRCKSSPPTRAKRKPTESSADS